jgi:mRNA-degrading endonuclease RelE of RelBE toxin-antitoxin system
MNVKQSINQKLDRLSEKEQKQILEFVDLVHQRSFDQENEE